MCSEKLYNRLHDDLLKEALQVYEVFKEFFTEELVDYRDYITPDKINDRLDKILIKFTDYKFNDYKFNDDYCSLGRVPEKELDECIEDGDNYAKLLNIVKNDCNYAMHILIKFPKVTISNEYNQSIDIQDLFVKVCLDTKGLIIGTFSMIRTTYSLIQWTSNYMHSHINGITEQCPHRETRELDKFFGNDIAFKIPCLGTGPIKNTIMTLIQDSDLDIWKLFCLELSRYVRNESLIGIPYMKLNAVSQNNTTLYNLNKVFAQNRSSDIFYNNSTYSKILKIIFKNLTHKFIISNNKFTCTLTPLEYVIYFSDIFIRYYNSPEGNHFRLNHSLNELLSKGYIYIAEIKNGKLYTIGANNNSANPYFCNNKELFKFKGIVQHLKIVQEKNLQDKDRSIYILSPTLVNSMRIKILSILDYLLITKNIKNECYGFERGKIKFL